MALDKLYNRQTWHNNTTPALNETNLNVLSKAVDDIDDRVIDIAGTVMETVPQVQEDLEEAQELLEDAEAINSHPPIIGKNGNWWTWDTSTNAYVDSGKDASVTVSVNPNTETLPAGSNAYVRNVGTSTDPVLLFGIPKGDKGETGGATPGSDVADTIVGEITASSATYPEPEEGETIKVIIGKIKKFLDDLKTKKADKVTSATSGHLAGLDSNGNLTDSGKSSSAVIPSGGTTGQVLKKSSGTDYAVEWGTASSGGHTILNDSGTAMTSRSKLQFEGIAVSDDSTNGRTVVKIPKFTTAEWDAISYANRQKYDGCMVNITDDFGVNEVEIYKFMGTTSLSGGYQRLDTKILSESWASIRNKYRYILIVGLGYSNSQTEAEFGKYSPSASCIYPTDIRADVSSGQTYLNLKYIPDLDHVALIQIAINDNNTVYVYFLVNDSSATTYNAGYAIYGIK